MKLTTIQQNLRDESHENINNKSNLISLRGISFITIYLPQSWKNLNNNLMDFHAEAGRPRNFRILVPNAVNGAQIKGIGVKAVGLTVFQ